MSPPHPTEGEAMRFLRMLLFNLVAVFACRRRHKLWAIDAALAELYRGIVAP